MFIDDKAFGYMETPNLTGGAGQSRRPAGRRPTGTSAIRHGVGPDHGGHWPSCRADEYQYFTDDDCAALVAYITTVPKVDRSAARPDLRPDARARSTLPESCPSSRAEVIRHDSVGNGHSFREGEYLARTGGCFACHGAALAGGAISGCRRATLPAANISTSGMINWTLTDFTTALRTWKAARWQHPQGTDAVEGHGGT